MIYAVYGERKKKEVMQDTLGHLAPKQNTKYPCKLLIASNEQDSIIVEQDFGNLPSSPWLYADLMDFLYEQDLNVGIYICTGWYKKFKNGNYQFGGGKIEQIEIGGTKL